jgi:hypothetical protein
LIKRERERERDISEREIEVKKICEYKQKTEIYFATHEKLTSLSKFKPMISFISR